MGGQGERPHGVVTFVFTDLERSTEQWERAPEAMDGALARHDQLVEAAVAGAGGVVFATGGDGYAAAFHSPDEALRATTEFQVALAGEDWPGGVDLRARVGIHCGQARERDGNYFGPEVIRAARLMAVAHGGQTLVSSAAASLVTAGAFDLVDLGEHRLKDLERPETVHQLRIPDLRSEFPPLRAASGPPSNLPAPPAMLIGRDAAADEVASALAEARCVTLLGAGGVGKTTLAVAVAHRTSGRWPDGTFFLDLAGRTNPAHVEEELGQVLGVLDEENRRPLVAAAERLASAEALLVVDNCEHLIEATASIVEHLADACPHLRILATSREPLGIGVERVRNVRPLDEAAAIELFERRAAASGVTLDARDVDHVRTICERLDAIPLAIELAAARVRALAPADLAARLDDRFRLLTGGHRTALPRQRTLEAAVAWSFDLLEPPDQGALLRLSVLAGPFGLDAAEAVCGPDALDSVPSLVDRSLLEIDRGSDVTRYRMLETVRAFARERLAERAGDARSARDGLLGWAAAFARRERRALSGPDAGGAVERIRRDLDNLRVALAWSLDRPATDDGLFVASSLYEFWDGHGGEGGAWLSALAERIDPSTPDDLAGRALRSAGILALRVGDTARAADHQREAARRFLAAGRPGDADVARFFELWAGGMDSEVLRVEGRELIDRRRREGDLARFVWLMTWFLPVLLSRPGSADADAIALLEEFEAASAQIGQRRAHAHALEYSAGVALGQGDATRARRGLVSAIDEYLEVQSPICSAHCVVAAGVWLLADGAAEAGALLVGASREASRRYGWMPMEASFEDRLDSLGVRPVLDPDALAEGRHLDVDDALRVARDALS